jgi:hypothetical protein
VESWIRHSFLRSCGASLSIRAFAASSFTTCQTTSSVRPSPQVRPTRLTRRNIFPTRNPTALQPLVHSLFHPFRRRDRSGVSCLAGQVNNGPLLFPLPEVRDLSSTVSCRLRPRARSTAISAQSHFPFIRSGSRASSSVVAWSGVNQLPNSTPIFFSPWIQLRTAPRFMKVGRIMWAADL